MKKQTASQTSAMRAVIDLRQEILSGELAGGTRLFEPPLAERLGISRTPVREALSRLAEEGLLDRAPSGGFAVRSFRFADVVDAIELRGVLEGTAARLAAERGAEPVVLTRIHKVLAELDEVVAAAPEDIDIDAYTELNARFHDDLVRLAGSEMVLREVDRVNRLPFASPSAFLPTSAYSDHFRQSLRSNQETHRSIVNAIEGREGSRAEALTREHAREARANLEFALSERGGLINQLPSLALVMG